MTFIEMLKERQQKVNSMVCVGLDSDYSQIPESVKAREVSVTIPNFNANIIDATKEYVCAYKPNMAFYEDQWVVGLSSLKDTISYIRDEAPDVPIILDAKRTDIGNTNKGYVRMAFDNLKADAITVNPYFGGEALEPFLDRTDKGIIVLCRTSNKGAKDFQDIKVYLDDLPLTVAEFFGSSYATKEGVAGRQFIRLYHLVAYKAAKEWNKNGNVLLVVGATYPDELKNVREIVGDTPILVPGIGAQGGELEATVKAGLDSNGFGMIINSSRGIIFASKSADFAEAAGREAKKIRDQINEVKASIQKFQGGKNEKGRV
ncbi:MAG: orotidine-5'-phosphate decarboxylase [Candidatus Pacebacteria bacterium]|nr:orotidine-5'-phosphate decarboxylase [Candidatus Paceibacterota bacterium]